MAELGDMLTYASNGDEEGIHVEMLDYGYIETCTDPKTLRGIVQVLKSGKEGLYPEVSDWNRLLPSLLIYSACNSSLYTCYCLYCLYAQL